MRKITKGFRYGLCLLAGLACSVIFGGGISHAANTIHEEEVLNSTYSVVAKATPAIKPGTWERVDDYEGSGSVQSSDGKYYYRSAKYKFTNGTYANNQWIYALDENGSGPYWYWIGPDGFRTYGWQLVNGKGYFLGQTQGKWHEEGNGWDYSHETNTIKGVDVSYWQHTVDWKAFKDAGIDFAFMRAGYGTESSPGSHDNLDSTFHTNMKEADKAGIACGVYYYSTARSQTQAVTDARFLIKEMQGHKVSYPVVIDLESDAKQGDLSKERLTEITRAFCEELKLAGYTPMIYVNYNWYTNHLDMSKLSDIDVWLATYSSHHSYSIDPAIWQCCSTTLRPDGKNYDSGNRIDSVDLNFGYKDYRKIITPRTTYKEGYSLDKPTWHKDSGGWWLYLPGGIGSIARHCFKTVDGKTYYFDGEGYALKGKQIINDKEYYFKSDYSMACNEWIDDKYYDKDGVYDPDHPIGTWIKSGNRWWYKHYDGTYTKNNWELIKGKWYFFDANGWMKTGWLKWNGYWYYLDANGEISTGWIYADNLYYYADAKGHLLMNCWIDNQYYVGNNGVYIAEKTKLGTEYFGKWILVQGKYKFQRLDQTYATNKWELINGKWYFFDERSILATGWLKRNNIWFYLGTDGALRTGWFKDGGFTYYANEYGHLQANCWIDDKYVGKSGIYTARKTSEGTEYLGTWQQTDDKSKFQHLDKTYTAKEWELIDGKWYFFDEDSYMVTGWIKCYSKWYYLGTDGVLVTGWFEYEGNWYYANEKGQMQKDTYVDGYYLNPSGIRVDNAPKAQ